MLRTSSSLILVALTGSAVAAAPLPVVGGKPASPGEWPDAVAVLAETAACTGTLIAPDVVLTAGHCIETHPIEVIANTIDYAVPGGEVIKVKSATAYPKWADHYDVGVLVLDHPAASRPRVIAGACDVRDQLVAGKPLQLVGFGLTTKSGTGENSLLHQAMLPVDDARCTDDPACEPNVAPDGEFTAGGHGSDSCFGDSGGPVYLTTPAGPALIGVVSRGLALPGAACASGGVYVRADKVIPWIERVTGRRLTRSTCSGAGDAPDSTTEMAASGGCSTGGGAGLSLALAVGFVVSRRRRAAA